MESNPSFEYNLLINSPLGQAIVQLGQEQGWLEHYRQLLDTAICLSLIPRRNGLPFISVKLGDGKRWIYFSRVIGKLNYPDVKRQRLYAIGWQKTIRGENVKCLLWVHPDGSIECSD